MTGKDIKIIHTADIHLGYDSYEENYDFDRKQEIQETFHRIISVSIKEKVDLILIAGDLFDTPNPPSEAVDYVIRQFRRIPEIFVIISPGNHDYYTENSPYDEIGKCSNVLIFDGAMDYFELDIRGQIVRVFGAAFNTSRCYDSLFNLPLIKENTKEKDVINIGLLHASLEGKSTNSGYDPIKLEDIKNSNLDYLALGHFHKPTKIKQAGNTYYGYSGCPEAMSFKDTGRRGIYIGGVSKHYAGLRFVDIAKRKYIKYELDLTDIDLSRISATEEDALVRLLSRKLKEDYGDDYVNNLYQVVLSGKVKSRINIDAIYNSFIDVKFLKIEDKTTPVDSSILSIGEKKEEVIENNRFYIKSIFIKNFGGLENFQMEFDKGFNFIYGDNEFGKTTIMAFIRMMFYGKGSKSQDLYKNYRKKYKPLNGHLMAGNINFVINDKEYLVTKEFGNTKGEDICDVYDLQEGIKKPFSSDKEIGEYFLNISEEEFEKTLFVGENTGYITDNAIEGLFIKLADMELEKLGIHGRASDINKLEKDLEKLKSKRGNKGKIIDKADEITKSQEKISYLKKEFKDVTGFDMDEEEDIEDKINEKYNKNNLLYNIMRILTIVSFVVTIFSSLFLFIKKSEDVGMYMILGIVVTLIFMVLSFYFRKVRNDYHEYDYDEELVEKIISEIDKHKDGIERMRQERVGMIERYNDMVAEYKELKSNLSNIERDVFKPISARVIDLVNMVWEQEVLEIILDENRNLYYKTADDANFRSIKYLSTSMTRLMYICVRIAICEMLNEKGICLPILIDDELNAFDENNFKRTINLFEGLDMQVILFSCRKKEV